jgi:hypothetical protein
MLVEIYVGYGHGHGDWCTYKIDIPTGTKKTIDELIDEYMYAHLDDFGYAVAFWGLYNISEDEDVC